MKNTENFRDKRRQQREENEKKFNSAVRRNWIILIVSLCAVVAAYLFSKGVF